MTALPRSVDDLTRAHGFVVELLTSWATTEQRAGQTWHRGVDVRADVMARWTARAEALGRAVTQYRCAPETAERADADLDRTLAALRETRDMLRGYDVGGDELVTLSTNVLGMAVADLDIAIRHLDGAIPAATR